MKSILIFSASQNNLKEIDLQIPFYHLTVVVGPSGSGKSSLVFDTLYAEGQTRYFETFSTYVRQYFERLPRSKVKEILNIPPAIAFPQGNFIHTSRSTVGTLTEINHFVKMLFYYCAIPVCPNCSIKIKQKEPFAIAKEIIEHFPDQKIYILAVKKIQEDFKYLKKSLLNTGFTRVFVKDRVCEVEELEDFGEEEVEIVVSRAKAHPKELSFLAEQITLAFKISKVVKVKNVYGQEKTWLKEDVCPNCGWKPPYKTPQLFSFNSSSGACPECSGFGNILVIDFKSIIKDPHLSIKDGAISLLDFPFLSEVKIDLYEFLKKQGISIYTPFKDIPEEIKQFIFYGKDEWYGLKEVIDWLERKKYKEHIRMLLSKLRREEKCPSCKGSRFNPKVLNFYYQGINIGEFCELEVKELKKFLEKRRDYILKHKEFFKAEEKLLNEILKRLSYLEEVGLDYLTLNRASKTLSTGEVSRCLLTRALSSELSETLYLIDEPTTGLHPKDTKKILSFIRRLIERRNTAIVVEHDPEIIFNADYLIELGPEGGERGGYLLFEGSPKNLLKKDTPTSKALSEIINKSEFFKEKDKTFQKKDYKFWNFSGFRKHNLKNFSVKIPKSVIVCIVGPSGSGKSTLMEELYERFSQCEDVSIAFLKQEPIAKSPRSVIMSYLDIYPFIRKLFASTKKAKELGLSESAFSFNSPSYQCPVCKGLGYEVIEMQFLSDIHLPCEYCKGKRFKEIVLEIKWKDKTIWDIFQCTVEEGLKLFKNHSEIRKVLEVLNRLGLGYLKLGQPLSSLSGGEAQRLRIAEVFLKGLQEDKKEKVILLDEPTIGLHLQDIKKLINSLQILKEKGYTIIIIEHNPEIIINADYLIELGPEGGEKGGYLLFEGTLSEFLKVNTSTSKVVAEYLSSQKSFLNIQKKDYDYEENFIKLEGVSHHNLKNFKIEIPKNKLVVITGVSGSGKSTLAFDVIFSEGQRRFLETLPAYLRQFIKLHEEIQYEKISGIPPTIALEQKSGELSAKATVGTLTDILSYIRLLYAKLSYSVCPYCNHILKEKTVEELKKSIIEFFKNSGDVKAKIFVPLIQHRKGMYRQIFERYLKRGEHYFRVDQVIIKVPPIPKISRYQVHNIDLYLGEVSIKEARFLSIIDRALKEGEGEVLIEINSNEYFFSIKRVCPKCHFSLPEPDPLLFAFNSKIGACPYCKGLGCSRCDWTRYKKEVNFYKINGVSLPELLDCSVKKAIEFFEDLKFDKKEQIIGEPLRQEILKRLRVLKELGLDYLSLSRSANTLSSGEAKRVRIAQAIGSNLTGVAYILDEPTIGLHPQDTKKLIKALKTLRDKGNTVLVIEHDEETILSADYLIELGPKGGKQGGKLVFAGTIKEFLEKGKGATFEAIKDKERRKIKSVPKQFKNFIILENVRKRNLKNITVKIPIGALVVVVGVSGSGKSTLICEELYERYLQKRGISGIEKIGRMYLIDHSPIGNNPSSTPATYIGVYSDIRKAFANTLTAKAKGYREGHFSFNTKEGQCPYCKGQGYVKLEIKFLPPVYQMCEYCEGKRYKKEILEIELNGKNIAEVLEMDFASAKEFFRNFPNIYRKLEVVCEIGLDYISLGQPSHTLSGGEAQRIKLAKEFVKNVKKSAVYILDEPTTGLHIKDIEKLVKILKGLVEKGHTVIVIEHNFELIKHADYLIELGPEGGEKGGYLLFEGTLTEFLKVNTPTSTLFKDYLF